MRSYDKLKAYLHYHNGYGHNTWQDGEFPWAGSTHEVSWQYNHIALRDHVINYNHYTTMSMATELGRVGLYNELIHYTFNPLRIQGGGVHHPHKRIFFVTLEPAQRTKFP